MNQEELDRIIQQGRAAFDRVESPNTEKIWRGIEARRRKSRGGSWRIAIGRNWRYTIAATVVLAAALYFLLPQRAPTAPEMARLAQYYPQLQEEEQSYRRLIAQRKSALSFSQIDREQYPEIFRELATLDSVHREILRDAPRYYDNERLIRTLMRYYEQKVRILDHLSKEIEKNETHDQKHNSRRSTWPAAL